MIFDGDWMSVPHGARSEAGAPARAQTRKYRRRSDGSRVYPMPSGLAAIGICPGGMQGRAI